MSKAGAWRTDARGNFGTLAPLVEFPVKNGKGDLWHPWVCEYSPEYGHWQEARQINDCPDKNLDLRRAARLRLCHAS
jgi:hypothetical protein